eukprot:TRINITY_DN1249_c1_g1_i1.p1 TRINITY_DN1249_c1_g1~~TRINITY_DN1249_c1_g1_i1.p1  ORF type:complete len:1140 (-),score=314.71 TRINITY_DN1249_c1_g1_i1:99-3518(-)
MEQASRTLDLSRDSSSDDEDKMELESPKKKLKVSRHDSGQRASARLKDKKRSYSDSEVLDIALDLQSEDEKMERDERESELDEEAAAFADLPAFQMSALETQELPQLVGIMAPYIQTRNHILRKWKEIVKTRQILSVQTIMKDMQEKFKCIVPVAYEFLQRFGFINTGLLRKPPKSENEQTQKKKIIVIGAGMAGLCASRQLVGFGHEVILLEGRDRVGGRCKTDWSLGAGIDLGASIITGLEGNPLTILCQQLDTKLHVLNYSCPIYDVDGKDVDKDIDRRMETSFNHILESSKDPRLVERVIKGREPNEVSLMEAIEGFLEEGEGLSESERRVFDWHVANLEYGCASNLNRVSLPHWDQDDGNEWGGDHCLLKEGYSTIAKQLAEDIDLRLNSPVESVEYSEGGNVTVKIRTGEVIEGDVVLVTLPLGVLKEKSVEFSPPLPEWKTGAIERLGFGLLNKVALSFPHSFWDPNLDYFGQTNQSHHLRGEYYMFWNLERCTGTPVLIALMAGEAAYRAETSTDQEVVDRVLNVLQKRFGDIPSPTNTIVTRWAGDSFSRGSYSFVKVGANGDDYDLLAKPVGDRLFFAGEATIRTHPATAAGAYLSGRISAGKIEKILRGQIHIDFDTEKIAEDWNREISEATDRRRRDSYQKKNNEKTFKKGRTRVKAARFEYDANLLFLGDYTIPKKKKSEGGNNRNNNGNNSSSSSSSSSSSQKSGSVPSKVSNGNSYNPLAFRQKLADFMPRERKIQPPSYRPPSSTPPPPPVPRTLGIIADPSNLSSSSNSNGFSSPTIPPSGATDSPSAERRFTVPRPTLVDSQPTPSYPPSHSSQSSFNAEPRISPDRSPTRHRYSSSQSTDSTQNVSSSSSSYRPSTVPRLSTSYPPPPSSSFDGYDDRNTREDSSNYRDSSRYSNYPSNPSRQPPTQQQQPSQQQQNSSFNSFNTSSSSSSSFPSSSSVSSNPSYSNPSSSSSHSISHVKNEEDRHRRDPSHHHHSHNSNHHGRGNITGQPPSQQPTTSLGGNTNGNSSTGQQGRSSFSRVVSSSSSSSSSATKDPASDTRRAFKDQLAVVVRKCLSRYLEDGKIDKENFKSLARSITHSFFERENSEKSSDGIKTGKVDDPTKKRIKKFVSQQVQSKKK